MVETSDSKLFSDGPRLDPSPIGHAESLFSFYDRAAGTPFDKARSIFETLYAQMQDHDGDVRRRFQASDEHHEGAVLELVANALLTTQGMCPVHHAETPSGRKIDFLFRDHGVEFYLECRNLTENRIAAQERSQRRLASALNERVVSRDFMLEVRFEQPPSPTVPLKPLCSKVQEWLNGLSYKEAENTLQKEDVTGLPRREFRAGEGLLVLTAWPRCTPESGPTVGPQHYSLPGLQPLEVLKRLESKRSRVYGRLDKPYILAVHDKWIGNAPDRWVHLLAGYPYPFRPGYWVEGFWCWGGKGRGNVFPLSRARWRRRGMSAVAVFSYKSIHDLGDEYPLLIPHPSPEHSADMLPWPFRRLRIQGNEFKVDEGKGLSLKEYLDKRNPKLGSQALS